MRMRRASFTTVAAFALVGLWPRTAMACAVCFGAGTGDNPDAAGLNLGVGVLFAFLIPIQILVGLLFVRMVRRSKDVAAAGSSDRAVLLHDARRVDA